MAKTKLPVVGSGPVPPGIALPPAYLQLIKAAFVGEVQAALDILREEPVTPARMAVLAANALTFFDTMCSGVETRRSAKDRVVACREGCAWCCRVKVSISGAELALLSELISSTFTDAERADLTARVQAADAVTRGLTSDQRGETACPLLIDGKCSVYAFRPLACRGWTSFDAETCRRAVDEPEYDGQAETDGFRLQLSMDIREAVAGSLFRFGLDGSRLELIAALRLALERPDAIEKWLAGRPILVRAYDSEAGDTGEQRSAALELMRIAEGMIAAGRSK